MYVLLASIDGFKCPLWGFTSGSSAEFRRHACRWLCRTRRRLSKDDVWYLCYSSQRRSYRRAKGENSSMNMEQTRRNLTLNQCPPRQTTGHRTVLHVLRSGYKNRSCGEMKERAIGAKDDLVGCLVPCRGPGTQIREVHVWDTDMQLCRQELCLGDSQI